MTGVPPPKKNAASGFEYTNAQQPGNFMRISMVQALIDPTDTAVSENLGNPTREDKLFF